MRKGRCSLGQKKPNLQKGKWKARKSTIRRKVIKREMGYSLEIEVYEIKLNGVLKGTGWAPSIV